MSDEKPITFPAPTADWGTIIDPYDPSRPHTTVILSTGERIRVTAATQKEIDEIDPVAWAKMVEEDDAAFTEGARRWIAEEGRAVDQPLPRIQRILCAIIVCIMVIGVVWVSVWADHHQ